MNKSYFAMYANNEGNQYIKQKFINIKLIKLIKYYLETLIYFLAQILE